MRERLLVMAARLWPWLDLDDEAMQARGVAWAAGLLYAVPLALGGLVWLTVVTDWSFLRNQWPLMLLFLFLRLWLSRFDFAGILDTDMLQARGSQGRLITWSAALLFGPTVLWVEVIAAFFVEGFPRVRSRRAGPAVAIFWARELLPALTALWLYDRWGGNVIPLNLTLPGALPALYATLARMALLVLLALPLFVIELYAPRRQRIAALLQKFSRFWLALFIFYLAPDPFALLAAGLYVQNGLWIYLFLVTGLFFLIFLADNLSHGAVSSRRHAHELTYLEQLARAILNQPVDQLDLPRLLADYLPDIAGDGCLEVRLFPDTVLYQQGRDNPSTSLCRRVPQEVLEQVQQTEEPYVRWRGGSSRTGPVEEVVLVPIVTAAGEPKGALCAQSDASGDGNGARIPVLLTLAAQIAAALEKQEQYEEALALQAEAYQEEVYVQAYQAETYAQALAYQKLTQELELAGRIQASFLPQALPEIAGWQLAVTLEPAKETSGDYYDIITLPGGRLGILVADVADKGMGAALYMALSRTLIRTYAEEYMAEPEKVLAAANRRILADTVSDLFVTVFYAVLDLEIGLLTYCNAGHTPPFLWQSQNGNTARALKRTALPLGILEEISWERASVQMEPGDVLILYTDGVTEAQNEADDFFGEERLQAVVDSNLGRSADVIEGKLISAVYDFVGSAPQFDDITLMILVREA